MVEKAESVDETAQRGRKAVQNDDFKAQEKTKKTRTLGPASKATVLMTPPSFIYFLVLQDLFPPLLRFPLCPANPRPSHPQPSNSNSKGGGRVQKQVSARQRSLFSTTVLNIFRNQFEPFRASLTVFVVKIVFLVAFSA